MGRELSSVFDALRPASRHGGIGTLDVFQVLLENETHYA